MIRKAYIIGTLALGLAVTASHPAEVSRLVSSAQSFRHHFHALKAAENSLGPIGRFVFSMVLANTKTSDGKVAVPARHT